MNDSELVCEAHAAIVWVKEQLWFVCIFFFYFLFRPKSFAFPTLFRFVFDLWFQKFITKWVSWWSKRFDFICVQRHNVPVPRMDITKLNRQMSIIRHAMPVEYVEYSICAAKRCRNFEFILPFLRTIKVEKPHRPAYMHASECFHLSLVLPTHTFFSDRNRRKKRK